MSFFGTPKEVVETKNAVAVTEKILVANSGAALASSLISREAKKRAAISWATKDAIRNHGWTANDLAWQIIANVAWDEILSSHHHTYRGVLTPTGHAIKASFGIAMQQLIASGQITEEYGKNEIKRLDHEVGILG